MIFIGDNEYPIYLGDNEIPAIYCGEELIYPVNLGTLTGITLENLTWVIDVPSEGGTATEENCSYKVVGHYDSGKNRTVTKDATVTGSLIVPDPNTGDTRIDIGTLELTATYSGFTASGSVEAYQEAPYLYLRITNRTNGDGVITLTKNESPHSIVLRTRTNGGSWSQDITYSSNSTITLPANGYVEFNGINNDYWGGTDNVNTNYWKILVNVDFDLSGDLFSLVSARTITHYAEFMGTFRGNTTLINASGLTMSASTVTVWGFGHLFNGCTNLVSAPELPATNLATYCYRGTFMDCSGLTTAQSILPATTLAENCYYGMYQRCSNLTTAPELPALTIVKQAYLEMFRTCSKLNYIKCLATGIASNGAMLWVENVASSGTFVKNPSMSSWPNGANGIPLNWTVVNNA